MDDLHLLLWYWGKRGGPMRIAQELLGAFGRRDDVALSVSFSRQSEFFEEAHVAAGSMPACHVDTFGSALDLIPNSLRLPALRRRFARFVAEHRIEVAFGVMQHIWSAAMFPAVRNAGARVLLAVHDAAPHPGEWHPFWTAKLRAELVGTDGVIAHSDHVRETLIEIYRYPKNRIWMAPHLSPRFFAGALAPRDLPTSRALRLLFFGRLVAYKGLDLLAAAFAELAARMQVELRIVGEGDEAILAPFRLCPGVTIENRWVPESEIPSVLALADLVVLPYREASQSGVVPMAYSLAIPVIGTPVGGLREQIRSGETGLLAEDMTAPAIARAIERLGRDGGLYRACSEGALAESAALDPDRVADLIADAARALRTMPRR